MAADPSEGHGTRASDDNKQAPLSDATTTNQTTTDEQQAALVDEKVATATGNTTNANNRASGNTHIHPSS